MRVIVSFMVAILTGVVVFYATTLIPQLPREFAFGIVLVGGGITLYLMHLLMPDSKVAADSKAVAVNVRGSIQIDVASIESRTNENTTIVRNREILVSVTINPENSRGYVHIFQSEAGETAYYYQGSGVVANGEAGPMRVWLGGPNDAGKTYVLYAILNEQAGYPKDSDGIYFVRELPRGMEVARQKVKRIADDSSRTKKNRR
ncbi:MAG: hypothetical protein HS115_06940 [Spirochaetales bacterium]|nr:hypothetical protein [Spirochaetales bacterium]